MNVINTLAILNNTNIVSGSLDTTIKVWQSVSPFQLITTLYGHTYSVVTLAIMPNSNIVSGSLDKTIKIIELIRNIELQSMRLSYN